MTLDKRLRERLLAHCGQLHDDDCVDPREFFKPKRRDQKQDRKSRQLCRQVARTLELVFSGEFDDEALRCLRVLSVGPAPDSSRLLVTICAEVPEERFDREMILGLLNGRLGRLRSEVAASITRKRVPNLVFHVTGPSGPGEVKP